MRSCPIILLAPWLLAAAAAQPFPELASQLACGTENIKPFLDFEFRFVAGQVFFLPIKQFVGQSVALDLEVLVEPTGGTPGIPARLRKRMADPREIPLDAAGFINFSAAFSVGIGNYRANWRVSDDAGRSCQGQWDFKANQSRGNRNVDLALRPGQIVDPAIQVFRDEPSIERPHLPTPRRLKIFISLDVVGRRGRLVRTRLTHVLPHFSALRQLVRSLHFNQFALVVFSFEDRSVLVRQDYGETLDFKPLGDVVDRLQPATVDLRQLARGSELRFFERLLSDELVSSEKPDGVVFIGQDLSFGRRLQGEAIRQFRMLGTSAAFFDASRYAWRGVIGNFVRSMNGKEFRLHRPSDLARAVAGFERLVEKSRAQ